MFDHPKSVYILSAEPSGDALAVNLIRHLRNLQPGLTLHAIGGDAVRAEGFDSAIETKPLAVLGFTEGLKALPQVRVLARDAVRDIVAVQPDAVVLIDSWGFMIRVAKLLRASPWQGRIVKYVAPQVWAMRRGRAKVLAKATDRLLTLYPFDAPFFVRHGLPTTHVGNPVLDTDYAGGNGMAFRQRHGIDRTAPLLLVAFGSRMAEIERLTEDFVCTVAALKRRRPDLAVAATTVPATRAQLGTKLHNVGGVATDIRLIEETERLDAYAAADIALAKSGTVTTELADAGVPTVVAYRVSGLTYVAAKLLFKADYISIVNVAADDELMPEFVQDAIDPQAMAVVLEGWLEEPGKARLRGEALRRVTDSMRAPGSAGERAARAVLAELG